VGAIVATKIFGWLLQNGAAMGAKAKKLPQ
jgi:hypothetical protein